MRPVRRAADAALLRCGPCRAPSWGGWWPRYVVDREPRCGGHGRGRDPGDHLDLAVEVGLVGVAALGGNARGGVTRGEKVRRVVEAHQLRGAFGGEADLGSEAGPQALAAPADLVGQAVDPYPAPAGDRPPPGVGDLRIDRWAGTQPLAEDVRRDREPLVPGRGSAQPLLDLHGVADPNILQGRHGPGELG